MASNVSKTAFTLETTLTIAKSFVGLYRSLGRAFQSILSNIDNGDASWNTPVDTTSNTYNSLVLQIISNLNINKTQLQSYLSNQTTPDNEFIFRAPLLSSLQTTNNLMKSLLLLWQSMMPLSIADNNSTNEGKFQNFSVENQKIHLQNITFWANSIQVTLTTVTVLFGTVDKSEGTFVSNLHNVLLEDFIDRAHDLHTSLAESTDELDTLIENQGIYGRIITSQNAAKFNADFQSVPLSFDAFSESVTNILNELSK